MATTGSISPRHCQTPEFLHEFLLGASTGHSAVERAAVIERAPEGGLRTVSYRKLAALTAARSEELAAIGIGVGDLVALESDSSASALTLAMACSALGATFVPLSPESPAGRRRTIVGMTGPALYLRSGGEELPGLPAPTGSGCFGPGGLVIERAPARRAHHRTAAVCTDPAYVVFTSGSTGTPKGVVMSHRGYLAFCRGMLGHGIATAEDRVASTSPFQFDFSLLDAGLALGSGAALVPVPRALLRWPRRFVRFLREAGATQVNGVPSIWRPLLRRGPARGRRRPPARLLGRHGALHHPPLAGQAAGARTRARRLRAARGSGGTARRRPARRQGGASFRRQARCQTPPFVRRSAQHPGARRRHVGRAGDPGARGGR